MNRTAAVAWWCIMGSAFGIADAQDRELQVVVSAGRHDRRHAPVTVALRERLSGSVTLRTADGKTLPGQLTAPSILAGLDVKGELHFVLPELKAGSTATFTAVVRADDAGSAAKGWTSTEKRTLDFGFDGRPVLRYVHEAPDESSKEARERTNKVFHHLYDPTGTRTVTNGPSGFYPHHRGVFYGWSKVTYGDGKSCNIWGCNNAFQAHDRVVRNEGGPVLGRHAVEIRWHGAAKEEFARETREVGALNVPGGNLLEFRSELRAVLPPLKLDGDPQHAGFHFRADNEVNEATKGQTVFVRPDGAGKPGETRNWPGVKTHADLPWNAMSFVLGGKRYTAAYLDRPDNPKEARFSERDYGRFGSYFAAELDGRKTLRVRYRIWLQEGQMTPEEVAAKSADFVDPPEAVIR